jgi:hypothetical protein
VLQMICLFIDIYWNEDENTLLALRNASSVFLDRLGE